MLYALAYGNYLFDLGSNSTNATMELEGIFEILRHFEYYTPIIEECVTVGDEIYASSVNEVWDNIYYTEHLGYNVLNEMYYIMADITGEVATSQFEDWAAFSYYLGDLVYRVFVAQNDLNIVTNDSSETT
jgi:hypothetical protein